MVSRVQGIWFRAWGTQYMVSSLGYTVHGFEGTGYTVPGFEGMGYMVSKVVGYRVHRFFISFCELPCLNCYN